MPFASTKKNLRKREPLMVVALNKSKKLLIKHDIVLNCHWILSEFCFATWSLNNDKWTEYQAQRFIWIRICAGAFSNICRNFKNTFFDPMWVTFFVRSSRNKNSKLFSINIVDTRNIYSLLFIYHYAFCIRFHNLHTQNI